MAAPKWQGFGSILRSTRVDGQNTVHWLEFPGRGVVPFLNDMEPTLESLQVFKSLTLLGQEVAFVSSMMAVNHRNERDGIPVIYSFGDMLFGEATVLALFEAYLREVSK